MESRDNGFGGLTHCHPVSEMIIRKDGDVFSECREKKSQPYDSGIIISILPKEHGRITASDNMY